jgi:hypothetical protein
MARTTGLGLKRRDAVSGSVAGIKVNGQESGISVPGPDPLRTKRGARYKGAQVSIKVRPSGIIARVAKAMSKPGIDRARVFQSVTGKPVYAYSILANDPTKLVREDASGKKTIGKVVGGRFRPTRGAGAS